MRHPNRPPVLPSSLCILLLSCAPAPTPWHGATPETWPALRAGLAREKTAAPQEPWAARVSVAMREPRSGRVVDGRGGIAVAPGRAVRMILVGGAGSTMLDAWVTPQRWQVTIPPLALVRRGGADEPGDLPVGFLRWWFFRPLEGMLFAASPAPPATTWLLRDGRAVLELREGPCDRGSRLAASRRVDGHVERIDDCRLRPAPSPGDRVRYDDGTTGLVVEITLEALAPEPPLPEAFDDPDTVPPP